MNNRDLIEFAKFFSQGVDKTVNAYEKAQAAEIARERNRIAAQDKKDNMEYRRQLLLRKDAELASLDKYRVGSLDVKRAAAAAKAAGGGSGAGLSAASQALLNKYGVSDIGGGQGGGTTINNYSSNDGDNDALANGSSSADVDVPSVGGGTAELGYAHGGMVKSFAGGGIMSPGMGAGGIDGSTPLPSSGAAGSRSPLAAGANMFSSSFKVSPYAESIDEDGVVRRGQTRLQRWIDGPAKGGAAPTQAINPNPPVPGSIKSSPLAPLPGYARGGAVLPVDAGTSGPVSGRGYRAAPPVTRGSN